MKEIARWLAGVTGFQTAFLEHVLATVAVLLVLLLLSKLLLRIVFRREKDFRKRYQWRKFTNYTITGIAIVLLINIWFGGLRSIATFLGLLSAGLVLALREPVLNMAGWLFIIWKRPFKIGDRIKVGEFAGDVIDQRLFQFSINEIQGWVHADQATGRVVHIPNLKVFTEPQANYNYGFPFVWHEMELTITFESNWTRAKAILAEIVHRHGENLSEGAQQSIKIQSQRHLIFYDDLGPQVYVNVVENGIRLTLRYMCSLMRRRLSENAIWEDILKTFGQTTDIHFAYPTTRFFHGDKAKQPSER